MDRFNWSHLFQNSFFKKNIFELFSGPIRALIRYIPEERKLVHGDYGYGTVLSDHQEITGVLDWESALFGDPLYDIGHLIIREKESD
jgi:hygromycin-B 4-O-kinase